MITKKQLNQTNRKENLAETELVAIATMTTQCKEIITDGIMSGLSQDQITKQLNKAIAENVKILPIDIQEEARKTMVRSCKKWYFELSQSLNIYQRNLSNQIGINLVGKTHKAIMDEFRPYLDAGDNVAVPMIKNYQANVRSVLRTISAQAPQVINRTQGQSPYKVSLRNRAEMRVRYEANMEDVSRLKDSGVKLVWTSSHPNCSPRCKDFQGKLWSLDGSRGKINGIKYEPIEIAMRGKNNDGNGIISGYNCRHRLVEYTGQPAPNDYTKAEIEKEYAIDQKQRNYENRIRQLKTEERLAKASGDTKTAASLRKRWQKYTREYQEYSIKNNRAFYRWRCVISDDEMTQTQQTTPIQEITPIIKQATTVEQVREILTKDLGFVEVENSFNKIEPQLQIEITNQLSALEARFGAIKAGKATILSDGRGKRYAYVQPSTYSTPDNQKLAFNPKYNKEITIKMTERDILSNWSMPCNEENYSIYNTTHEYGHMLQNIMISDELKKRNLYGIEWSDLLKLSPRERNNYIMLMENTRKKVEKQCFDEIMAIAKKNNPNFSLKDNICVYGKTNRAEFFAEVFANSQLGKPNELGKAMEEWLKQRGY